MKTPMQKLFDEFAALSQAARQANDLQTANLIDFLCERREVAEREEKEQMIPRSIAFSVANRFYGSDYSMARSTFDNAVADLGY